MLKMEEMQRQLLVKQKEDQIVMTPPPVTIVSPLVQNLVMDDLRQPSLFN